MEMDKNICALARSTRSTPHVVGRLIRILALKPVFACQDKLTQGENQL